MRSNANLSLLLFSTHYEVYVMLCAICYQLYNLKNVKNIHVGVLILVKLQADFTKSNTPPWVFFHVFLIVQMIPNRATHQI